VFEPIESTNSIMAAAQPDQFPVIEALVRSLDNRQTADRPPLRILRLRSTNANDIAQVLDRSYSRRPAEERALKPVEIEADAATNTLIVSAHSELMPEIESVVSELNEAQAYDREGREIRIFPLKVARAEELARTIDQMYPEPPMPRDRFGRPMPQLQEQKEVFVRADAATNSLIVDAPAQRLAGFEQIVQSLDTLTESGDVELRTYTVTKADLNAVSQTLRQLASSGALGATGRTPVTVSTEPASRTLIVSGPSGIFDRVDAVVAEVDGSADRPATGLRMYRLERANAERVAEIVRPLLVTRLREAMAADGAAMADEAELIELVADRASNTIILSAPQGVQEVAEQLIAALDTEGAAVGRAVVRVVPLTFADASQVARTITQAIPGLDLPSGGPVNVVAATGSNALLLTGSQADLKKVEELIEPLDKQPFDPEKPSIETIALEHADAEQVRGIVESLLIDQQQTDPRYLALQMRYARGVLPQKPTIRVEAEARTNSLIVSGPAETIELARAVIERLDQPSEDVDRRVMTFTPANAEPARLADAVSRVIAETMPGGRRPVEVVADAGSGTVLVFGDDAGAAQAMTLLADFDDRTPVTPIVEVRSFELRHAGADAVAASLRTMLSDRARWPDAMRRRRPRV
jgi:type II secretory pathway component GspD/PulD (secretin)